MAGLEDNIALLKCDEDDEVILISSDEEQDMAHLNRSLKEINSTPHRPLYDSNTDLNRLEIILRIKKAKIIKKYNALLVSDTEQILAYQNFINGFQYINLQKLVSPWDSKMYRFYSKLINIKLMDPIMLKAFKMKRDNRCELCGYKPAGCVHILSACKVSLNGGRFSYRHDKVLEIIRECIMRAKALSIRNNGCKENSLITKANDWKMLMDTKENNYVFPSELLITFLRPDILFYSMSLKRVIIVELSVPSDNHLPKQHIMKTKKYKGMVESLIDRGYKVNFYALEVSFSGIPTNLFYTFFLDLGFDNELASAYLNKVCQKAVEISRWIWVHRSMKWKTTFGVFEPYHESVTLNSTVDSSG